MKSDPGFPAFYIVEQIFDCPEIEDIEGEVERELGKLDLQKKIFPGQTVAITAGSRGIRNIDRITRAVVDQMKLYGARPFIIPAMGSHGGATAEGQKDVLAGYGITEVAMGCEIRSAMETVVIGRTLLGTDVYLDKIASQADHIAVVNRIKPHTKLIGTIESGLIKMCLIGLGNRDGARTYHRAIDHYSWMDIVDSVTDIVIKNAPIAFGLAVIQNAYENIGKIMAVRPEDFSLAEPLLLEDARSMMGRLPFKDIDLLIVDEMGKDISGTGMDTNITGRKEGTSMKVVRVYVRDLTPMTHGNAQGIGLADFTTRRLVNKIDYKKLYINSLTAYRTDSCKIPMTFEDDREALMTAIDMAGVENPNEFKVVWIKNTLELGKIAVSTAYHQRIKENPSLKILSGPHTLKFSKDSNLESLN